MFMRMQEKRGGSHASMSAVLGALDAVMNPSAARARELLQAEHERVIPTPSPGDRLLDDGHIVITLPRDAT